MESRQTAYRAFAVLPDYLQGYDSATGLNHAGHLAEGARHVYEVAYSKADRRADERIVQEREGMGVALGE